MELLIGFSLAILVGVITGIDARKRGMKAWLWGIGTAASMFPILIIYFIVRNPKQV